MALTHPTTDTARACVIGNLNMDLLIRGIEALPQWGQEIVGTEHALFPAGQAGYLALGLATLQAPVSVIGVVGDDETGDQIIRALQDAGADADGVARIAGEQTGLTVALVRPDGERAFASNIGCSARLTGHMVDDAFSKQQDITMVALVGVFMVAGLDLRETREFFARCRNTGSTAVLDTGWDPENWPAETISLIRELLGEVDLFLPNLDEAEVITGQKGAELALATLATLCPGTIVIKCGADGSIAWHDGQILRHNALPTDVVDAVGAGDVFDAGLLAGLLAGLTLDSALGRAHAAASLYVSRAVDRFPLPAEVDALLDTHTQRSR